MERIDFFIVVCLGFVWYRYSFSEYGFFYFCIFMVCEVINEKSGLEMGDFM